MKPWEPQKDKGGIESMPAYQAFAEYRDMGPERAAEAVAAKLSKSISLMRRWSVRWSWVSRAQAYDAYLDSIQVRSREKALEDDSVEWAKTQRNISQKLIDKANAMLEFPLAKRTSQDGKTIVEPARWSFGDAAKLSDTGIKLGRLERGESTANVSVISQANSAFTRLCEQFPELDPLQAKAITAEYFHVEVDQISDAVVDGEKHVT